MRKFIVSDLHGNGEVYNTIMAYLENVNKEEEVKLYINGDLIDRGLDSFTMLLDVIDRIENKKSFEIEYLAGNHELMMWRAIKESMPLVNIFRQSEWLQNGGSIIDNALSKHDNKEYLYKKLLEFIGNLKIYNLFEEKICGKRVLLVHASAPKEVKEECDLRVKDNNFKVYKAVWDREEDDVIPFLRHKLGKDGYLTIIGHNVHGNTKGFKYNEKENYFNIDGACAAYALGCFHFDHIPLVEVEDGVLTFLIFNHNNEIIDGYKYDGELVKLSNEELEEKRKYINHDYDNCRESKQELIKSMRRLF